MKTITVLFSFLILALQAKADSFSGGTSMGFLIGILMVILFGVMTLIGKGAKKVDQQIDNHKLSRNPSHIKTNEKMLLQKLTANRSLNGLLPIAEVLTEADKDNFLGTSIIAISKQEADELVTAKDLFQKSMSRINAGDYKKLLWKHFSVDFTSVFESEVMSKLYYYHGYHLSRDGRNEEAERFKKEARRRNKTLVKQNLY